jgi:hypothetical protein
VPVAALGSITDLLAIAAASGCLEATLQVA